VHKKVRPALLEQLTERTSALRLGPGTEPGVEIGPLINAAAVKNASDHVEDAVRHGARVTTGGDAVAGAGHFYTPTVLDGITRQMRIARDETFGPVVGLTEFEHEDEVIESANSTPYGLAAYVYTRDYARMLRTAEQLRAGVVGANDGAPSTPNAPFGGVKASGYGREGGVEGIEDYLDTKYVSIGGVSGSPRVGEG
jgi:succinate-semialdehyde dehydrogenase/glutarate-semialdehyde dehydrogenase